MAVNVSNGVHGEIAEICFDHNQIKVLTNWVVELLSRVKTNVRLLPASTDIYRNIKSEL